MRKYKRNIVITVVAATAAAVILMLYFLSGQGRMAEVTVGGKPYGSYPLNKACQVIIESAEGGQNILVIDGESAYVSSANCKNNVCVKTGKIQNRGQSIVCLPHNIIIKIV